MPRDQTSQTDSLLQCAPVSIRHETRGCVLPESSIEPWPMLWLCVGVQWLRVQLFGVTVHGKEYSKASDCVWFTSRSKKILAHLHTVPRPGAPAPLARTGHSKQTEAETRAGRGLP